MVRAAAEGVGMYFSSGDGSGTEAPSSDPFAISVGGTTLGIGSTNNRLFETGWSTAVSALFSKQWFLLGEQGAAGGGPSLLWSQPRYQQGIVPAALATAPGNRPGAVRSAPDIGADADPFTGFAVGLIVFKHHHPVYVQSDIGGTSLAAPLVAGIVASAQQGQAAPFGFLNSGALHAGQHGRRAPGAADDPPHAAALSRDGVRLADVRPAGAHAPSTTRAANMFGYTGQVARQGLRQHERDRVAQRPGVHHGAARGGRRLSARARGGGRLTRPPPSSPAGPPSARPGRRRTRSS